MTAESEAWAELGLAFRELGQHEDALRAYGFSLALSPDEAETWHRAGVVLLCLRRDDEARRAFRRALALDPRHERARFNLGTLLGLAGSPEAAVHLAVLYRHDPDSATLVAQQLEPKEARE